MNRPSPVSVQPLGPCAAAAVCFRHYERLQVTAVVKVTLAFAHNGEMKRISPKPIVASEIHYGNSPLRSVRAAGELSPALFRVDVLFVGDAHAPNGEPVTRMPVRLAVASDARVLLDKRLTLVGDRTRSRNGSVSEAKPFTKMPIVYERALGGPGVRQNPLGTGVGGAKENLANITYAAPSLAEATACFGPIGVSWPTRKVLLGTSTRRALDAKIAEIPDDFAWSYFQSAPDDQRIDELPERSWIVLEGLNPTAPMLQMRLPRMQASARLYGPGDAEETTVLRADTLFIDGEEEIATVCFRGSFAVESEEMLPHLSLVCGVATAESPVDFPATAPAPSDLDGRGTEVLDVSALRRSFDPSVLHGTLSLEPEELGSAEALPFQGAARPSEVPPPPAPPIPGAPWSHEKLPRIPVPAHVPERTRTIAIPIPRIHDDEEEEDETRVRSSVAPPPMTEASAPPAPPSAPISTVVKTKVEPSPEVSPPPASAPKKPEADPWGKAMPAPEPAPLSPAPRPKPVVAIPSANPRLKQGLYGRFRGKG